MHLFLEKDDELKLGIIKYFDQSNVDWYTRNELANALNLGSKKVASMISVINENFDSVYGDGKYEIESSSGKGYRLKNRPKTIKKLEIFYYERSIAFLFMEKVLFDSRQTTVQFCLNNYTSLSTLNRKLQRAAPTLKSFKLKLNVSKGYLQGEEIRVRQFYYELFKYVYGTYEWPIKTVEKRMLQEQIKRLSIETKSDLNFIDRYTMEIYLAVAVIRIRQRHYIDAEIAKFGWLANHPLYLTVHKFLAAQFKQLDSVTSHLESEYIILLFMTSMTIDKSHNMIKEEVAFFKDNNVREYMLVRALQNNLIVKYENESQIMTDQLTCLLTRSIISLEEFSHVKNYDQIKSYLDDQQKKYPSFFKFVKEMVIKQLSGDMTTREIEQFLTEIIPILKANIPISNYEAPIKIGFFYETGASQQYNIKNRIVENTNKKVTFETNEHELTNMDIIIVDEKSYQWLRDKVPIGIPVLSFDNILSDGAIERVESAIENIRDK